MSESEPVAVSGAGAEGPLEQPPQHIIDEPTAAQAQMPRYKCHKEVWALKIERIEYDNTRAQAENRDTDGSALLVFEDAGYAPIRVDRLYLKKHDPHFGGYYVVYKDGYKSFSPADAFEEGYTRV